MDICSMAVHSIMEFISSLRSLDALADFDQNFLSSFEEKFKSDKDIKVLDPSELEWMQQIFAERWSKIAWEPKSTTATRFFGEDYTLNQKGANRVWISLARQLEKEFGKSYLEILMPTIRNKVEPNAFIRAESSELGDLYIGDDRETWYSVKGLLKRIEMKQRFSTYNTFKYSPPRSLTLQELLRIRLKGQDDESFWNYMKKNIIPSWHHNGAVPQQMLSPLIEILEIYFSQKDCEDKWTFITKKLTTWSKLLCECPIDDVNCLFGQTIKVGDNKLFLIDILLDLLGGENGNLTEKLIEVVRWLFNYDGSLILYRDQIRALQVSASKDMVTLPESIQTSRDLYSAELKGLYTELNAGPWFDMNQLGGYLSEMLDGSPARIKVKISKFMEKNQDKQSIDFAFIRLITSLFDWRWQQIKGNISDYTGEQGEGNAKWIRLAQLLAGAGYISSNYYQFLMPTLKHDKDPVQLDSITSYPLSYYLLSQDEHELILIPNCINHFKASGYFCNCNATPPMPLTKIEIDRLQYADRRYRKFMTIASSAKLDEEPVSINTIKAIYTLVDQSLFTIGLQFGQDYNEFQSISAQKAYHTFYNFLHTLPKNEKDRLNAQRILFNGKYLSFEQIMGKIGKGECIAVYGQYLVQLVIDYEPHKLFKPEIEANLPLREMRANSCRKVYYEYMDINAEEATRRLKILLLSLMNYDFQYHDVKEEIIFWNIAKKLIGTPKEILQTVISSLASNDINYFRFNYVKILETMVKPACTGGKLSSPIHRWLMSIIDGTLFTEKHAWIEPTVLSQIASVSDFTVSQKIHDLFEQFNDDCVKIYNQDQNDLSKDVLINYKFGQLIHSLDDGTRKLVFALIDKIDSNVQLPLLLGAHLIHRLAIIGCEAVQWKEKQSFFGQSPYPKLKELLTHYLDNQTLSLSQAITILNSAIEKMDESICNEASKLSMIKYLEKFTGPGLISSAESDQELKLSNARHFVSSPQNP